MRKSIDGLSLVVAEELELNPVGPHCFVFCNRSKDKLKILQFDVNVRISDHRDRLFQHRDRSL